MPSFVESVGVQSWCFRHFKDEATVSSLVRQVGLSRIELCGVHPKFDEPTTWDSTIRTFKEAGVTIASIGVEGFANNRTREKNRFEFCKAAGVKVITCDFNLSTTPKCYRTAAKLAEKYDVYLAIHNHGGAHWLGNATTLDHVFKNTSERIGLGLDTAWAIDSREDPCKLAERFIHRLYAVHIKDFTYTPNRVPQDVVVGTGNLDLGRLIRIVRTAPRMLSCVLEYEGDVENPVPAIVKCVEQIKKVS